MASSAGPVALFDWDGTLHAGQTVVPWVNFLVDHRAFNASGAAELSRLFAEHDSGGIGYEDFVTKALFAYARGIRGQQVSHIEELGREFVKTELGGILPFVRPLMRRLKDDGITPIIVSGSPVEVINAFAGELGIACVHATELVVDHGTYVAGATQGILRNTAIGATKQELAARYAQSPIVLAAGDSVADLPMLDRAETRLVIGNPELLPADSRTFHLVPATADLHPLWQFLNRRLHGWEIGVA